MEAYLHVVKGMIEAQQGVECRLTVNFRSAPRILDVVNGVFEKIMEERPELQPGHVPLHPGRGSADEETAAPGDGPGPDPGRGGLPGAFLRAKQREREEYERRRLLYVAMTRPCQQLVVSFGDRNRAGGDSLLSMLKEAAGADLTDGASHTAACGAGEIAVEVVEEDMENLEPGEPGPARGGASRRRGLVRLRGLVAQP